MRLFLRYQIFRPGCSNPEDENYDKKAEIYLVAMSASEVVAEVWMKHAYEHKDEYGRISTFVVMITEEPDKNATWIPPTFIGIKDDIPYVKTLLDGKGLRDVSLTKAYDNYFVLPEGAK